jgi:hypothetical protein
MKKTTDFITSKYVDKRIDDSLIANSIIAVFFSGILLSLSWQHIMPANYIYVEAAILIFAAFLVGMRWYKFIFMSLVLIFYTAFFGLVLWSANSMYITGNASIFGVVLFAMIPAYIFYMNVTAFIALLKFRIQQRKS